MDGGPHVSARVTRAQKKRYENAARQMGVTVSGMLVSTLDVVSGKILGDGWECRMVHIDGARIVGIGEAAPLSSGLPLPVASFPIVAPRRLWALLERELLSD